MSDSEENLTTALKRRRKSNIQSNYGGPRELGQALLTYAQREYLLDQKEFQGDNPAQSEATLRNRMRDRIVAGISDFHLLKILSKKDRRLIFEKIDGTDHPLYSGLEALLQFVYLGVRDRPEIDFESLLEDAIKNAERFDHNEGRQIAEVVVNIDIQTEELPDLDNARKRLEEGKQVSDEEIGLLARFGMLTAEDLEDLHEVPAKLHGLPGAKERTRVDKSDTKKDDDED